MAYVRFERSRSERYVDFHEVRGVAARSREAALQIWLCMFLGKVGRKARGLVGSGLQESSSAQK